MAITNFGELKTAIANWSERSDLSASRIPECFTLAQAKMYRGERALDGKGWIRKPLRLRKMLVSNETLTHTAGVADLTDLTRYLEMKRVVSNQGTPVQLTVMPPEHFWGIEGAYITSSPPSFYTIEGDTLYTAPKDSVALLVSYYQTFTALSDDSDTDWVLTNAPHVYLYGGLMELFSYEESEEQAAKFTALFNGAVNSLDASEEGAALSGSSLVMRPAAVV